MTAAKLLRKLGTLSILFRQQDEAGDALRCRFAADMVKINFRDEFATDEEARAWLDEHLWLQRETIKQLPRSERYPTWESQYQAWETGKFLPAQTWYTVRGVREIKPVPLSQLRKLEGNQPLASNFLRGYALCHYPSDQVIRLGDG